MLEASTFSAAMSTSFARNVFTLRGRAARLRWSFGRSRQAICEEGKTMRRVPACLVVAFLAAPAAALAQPVAGPAKAKATTPEIPFESVPNFFKMPPGI